MKVLLWKVGGLGDVVMTTPLVRQLRRQHPQARIDYLTGHASRAMLEGNPHLDQVAGFDETILFGARLHRLPGLLALLRGYDVIYVLDKHWVFGWLAKLAGIPQRIGFRRRAIEGWPHTRAVPYGALRHEIDYYLDLAEVAGVRIDRNDRALELPPAERFPMEPPYVVAINSGGHNPGESSDVRRLPEPLFDALVSALAARSTVVFLGSAREHSQYEQLAARYGARNLCGLISLRQTWDVLAHAQAVYTTDTGLMHMAGAVCRQVVAVFGPTHPLRKCPPGARWVWADEGGYDADYELYGRLPRGGYFRALTADHIVEQVRPPTAAMHPAVP